MMVRRIERALALVDPMGLIHMGAPFDEYVSEARNIHQILGDKFSDDDFLRTYIEVMNASFGNSMVKFRKNEKVDLLQFLREDVSVKERFREGSSYKAVGYPLFRGAIDMLGEQLFPGEIITCVARRAVPKGGENYTYLMIRGKIHKQRMSSISESRSRWFLKEVA